jgi:hypothetical protein
VGSTGLCLQFKGFCHLKGDEAIVPCEKTQTLFSSIPAPASFVNPNSSPNTRYAARSPMPPGLILDFQYLLVVAMPI